MRTSWKAMVLFAALASCGCSLAVASPTHAPRWIGDYVNAKRSGNQAAVLINFAVRLEGGKLSVDFNGWRADGSGAKPSGEGTGRANGGQTLRFDFEDGYGNKGTGTFTRVGADRYRISIEIKEVKDARCLVFYHQHVLKRHSRPNFFVMAKS